MALNKSVLWTKIRYAFDNVIVQDLYGPPYPALYSFVTFLFQNLSNVCETTLQTFATWRVPHRIKLEHTFVNAESAT
jgi:hypothetical protein